MIQPMKYQFRHLITTMPTPNKYENCTTFYLVITRREIEFSSALRADLYTPSPQDDISTLAN